MHKSKQITTELIHSGKSINQQIGHAVNPPLVRASTVIFNDMASWREVRERRNHEQIFSYGARGTPTTFALEDAITHLEQGYRTRLYPTGLAAIAMVFVAYLSPGDHILISDSCYLPVRSLAEEYLKKHNISYDFFPANASGIETLIQANTRMIYMEAPGSFLYEMLDLPGLSLITKKHNILLVADNTWGSGLLYQPLTLGADISIMAATKYLGGHSDVMMGTVCTTEACWQLLNKTSDTFGMTVSPDDAWLVLRGIRSLHARLDMHQRNATAVIQWLSQQPLVEHIFSPTLTHDPSHTLWQRDCSGSNGLLSFTLKTVLNQKDMDTFLDAFTLFQLGSSWGGYESLISMAELKSIRTKTHAKNSQIIRLHVGLEAAEDLISDLEQAFQTLETEPY